MELGTFFVFATFLGNSLTIPWQFLGHSTFIPHSFRQFQKQCFPLGEFHALIGEVKRQFASGDLAPVVMGKRMSSGSDETEGKLWRVVDQFQFTPGANRTFDKPEDLWARCHSYFEWCEANPLERDVINFFQGVHTKDTEKLPRAFNIEGLCAYLGISDQTWRNWRRDRSDLADVQRLVENIIRSQHFEGGMVNMFNANLVGRVLGLADKLDHSSTDGTMSPNRELSREELEKELLARGLPIPDID